MPHLLPLRKNPACPSAAILAVRHNSAFWMNARICPPSGGVQPLGINVCLNGH